MTPSSSKAVGHQGPPLGFTVYRHPKTGALEVLRITRDRHGRYTGTDTGPDKRPMVADKSDCVGLFPTADLAHRARAALAPIDAHFLPELRRLRLALRAGESNHLLAELQVIEAIMPKWENAA